MQDRSAKFGETEIIRGLKSMDLIRFCQVHLDFHTSPFIFDVGQEFDPKEFSTLKLRQHVSAVLCTRKLLISCSQCIGNGFIQSIEASFKRASKDFSPLLRVSNFPSLGETTALRQGEFFGAASSLLSCYS